jgi:hypothetical protein
MWRREGSRSIRSLLFQKSLPSFTLLGKSTMSPAIACSNLSRRTRSVSLLTRAYFGKLSSHTACALAPNDAIHSLTPRSTRLGTHTHQPHGVQVVVQQDAGGVYSAAKSDAAAPSEHTYEDRGKASVSMK